jgi:hypothetical protein
MIVGVTIALAALAVIGSNYISKREDRILKQYHSTIEGREKGQGQRERDTAGRDEQDD